VSQHPFLSPEWIAAARDLRNEYADRAPVPTQSVRANLVISDAPFSDDDIDGHVDTSGGSLAIDEGHIDDPELTVKTDYATAKALFVDRDPAKAMEAFMLGKILVTGDVSKVLGFASSPPPADPSQMALANEIASRLSEITAG
jgi:hypothetical protein